MLSCQLGLNHSSIKACPYVHLNPPMFTLLVCKRIRAGLSYPPSSNSQRSGHTSAKGVMLQDLEVFRPLCSAAQYITESSKHGEGEEGHKQPPKRHLTPPSHCVSFGFQCCSSGPCRQAKPQSTHLHQPALSTGTASIKGLNWRERQTLS